MPQDNRQRRRQDEERQSAQRQQEQPQDAQRQEQQAGREQTGAQAAGRADTPPVDPQMLAQEISRMEAQLGIQRGGQRQGPGMGRPGMQGMGRVAPQAQSAVSEEDMGEPARDRETNVSEVLGSGVKQSRITKERLVEAVQTLNKYKAGKAALDARLVEVERWWRMRHWEWMQERGARDTMRTASAWLFNVIISKHADGIQSIPEANILPREESDKETAKQLSAIIPCVLDQNEFEETYSDALWQKLKGGTGVYGVFWDAKKLNGLGDISIRNINLLNLFWEPGITDIQQSQNVFLVSSVDRKLLKQQYPQLADRAVTTTPVTLREYISDDGTKDREDKALVVDWYYHDYVGGQKILQYCKFCGDVVLYATEDDPELAERGLYDHAMYPFVMDRLFPVEGSPCGFGYIDVCKGAQEQIDILNQAVVQNALVNATPRYFIRADGSVNEDEFRDFTRTFVHVNGNLGSDSVMPITTPPLDSTVIAMINNKVGELKETSGNTDSSNGITQNSNQAASAIAALQEAAGKVSRASTLSAYRAFCRMVNMMIELIRQFYDAPRQFRITGDLGEEQFMAFSNLGMQPVAQGMDFGVDMGYRLPVFDVKVSAQAKTTYTKNSQNELAMTLYGQGIFNPQMSDQALMLLDIMDFDGKDELMQKVAQNGTILQQMAMYQQIALQLAQQYDPALAEQLANTIMSGAAAMQAAKTMGGGVQRSGTGNSGITMINNARARSQMSAQPNA